MGADGNETEMWYLSRSGLLTEGLYMLRYDEKGCGPLCGLRARWT
jgi:hypothetical protein